MLAVVAQQEGCAGLWVDLKQLIVEEKDIDPAVVWVHCCQVDTLSLALLSLLACITWLLCPLRQIVFVCFIRLKL